MKQVSIRELQVNPSKCLEELPFEIVRYGKVAAVVVRDLKISGFPPPAKGVGKKPPKFIRVYETPELSSAGLCPKHPGVFMRDGYCSMCAIKK